MNVNQASVTVTLSGVSTTKIISSQTQAKTEKIAVVKNTPKSAIFFGASTAMIETALITSKLKAADPTIVNGPSAEAGALRSPTVQNTLSKISGADEPKAIKVRFAIVAFQTGVSMKNLFLFLSTTSTYTVFEVITSIASMKMSAIILIPRNNHIKNKR